MSNANFEQNKREVGVMSFLEEKRSRILLVIASFVVGIVFMWGIVSFAGKDGAPNTDNSPIGGNYSLAAQNSPPGVGSNTIADIVASAGPAVVKIDTKTTSSGQTNPFFSDPFFRNFFGDQFNLGPQVQQGLGSGFLISKDGYLLTNEHVVHNASEIKVTVSGYDRPFDAKVVGADFDLDLAILKINVGKNLPCLKLGNSDAVKVGNWVIAIGNPYGLDHTVTVGVISAKERPVSMEERRYENLLQTDASINPGNSGGPLLNLTGEVIGINTAINAQAQGIGFAIPTSTIQGVLQDLLTKGKIERPWMGVDLQEITPELADYFGLSKPEGALITSVQQGSPAARAGLKRGDVITELDKKPVTQPNDVVKAVQNSKIGQHLTLLVYRNQRPTYVTVTITAKPQ
jgi:serine protease Do